MTDHLSSEGETFIPTVGGLAGTTLVHDHGELSGGVPLDQPEREFTVKARSQRQMVVRRFFHHRLAMVCLGVLIFVVLLAFVGIHLWKYDFSRSGPKLNNGRPTLDAIPFMDGDGLAFGEHPFGQDDIGRDYFALTLRGAQRSIIIAVTVGALGTAFGTLIGALAGFYRGRIDNILMRFVDVGLTVPLLLVAAVLSRRDNIPILSRFFDQDSIFVLAFIIASASWLDISRVIRSEFLSLREKEYVEAARALGTKNRRIITKHILPNVAGTIIVTATLLISAAILIETALSFLGLGVRGTDTSLGKLVTDFQNASMTRPWLFYWPGVFIITIALCINFIGDGLRDAFDPKQTRVRA